MPSSRSDNNRLAFGILFILIGGALILGNFYDISFQVKKYLFKWELILVFIGIVSLLSKDNKGTGFVFLLVGGVLYAKRLDLFDVDFNFWQVFWASLLILIGLMIIFKRRSDKRCSHTTEYDEEFLDDVSVFGGGDRIVTSQNLKGGKLTSIFGGSNIDLSAAKLASDVNYLDVFMVFGGNKLIVPEDWNIKIKVVSIFGGFSDKHRLPSPDNTPGKGKLLVIKGLIIFGGGEIKSY